MSGCTSRKLTRLPAKDAAKARVEVAQRRRTELELQLHPAGNDLDATLDCRRRLADLQPLLAEREVAEYAAGLAELRAFDAAMAQAIKKQRLDVQDFRYYADKVLVEEPPEPVQTAAPIPFRGAWNPVAAHETNRALETLAEQDARERQSVLTQGNLGIEQGITSVMD